VALVKWSVLDVARSKAKYPEGNRDKPRHPLGWLEAGGAERTAHKYNLTTSVSASSAERVGLELCSEFCRRRASKCSSRMRRTRSSSSSKDLPNFNNFLTRLRAVASAARWCSALVPGFGTLGIIIIVIVIIKST
jgi:hypothetical protein